MAFHSRGVAALLAGILVCGALGSAAEANFTYYYDPATGNVSFDTTGSPSGEIWAYGLLLNRNRVDDLPTDLRFRPENHVNIFGTPFKFVSDPMDVSAVSISSELSGYFTMGDVLPAGLTQETWETVFGGVNLSLYPESPLGSHVYFDHGGRGATGVPPADLIYGQPDRPFDNRWDLVDPDELDWASSARLIYNPYTGEVEIDTTGPDGGHISYWAIQSDGAFLAENFTPWVDVPFTSANSDVIGFAADAIEPGVYSAGAILPAGLSLGEVQAAFTSARFMGRAGFGGSSFDIEAHGVDFSFAVAVPEPQALWLLALGAIGLGGARRL